MSELRKHERYKTSEEALALAGGNMAKIIDISRGGVSMLFLDNSLVDIPRTLFLDLLSDESKTLVDQIPGELIWEQEISFSSLFGITYKKVGVRFGKLSSQQKVQLDLLILHYAVGTA